MCIHTIHLPCQSTCIRTSICLARFCQNIFLFVPSVGFLCYCHYVWLILSSVCILNKHPMTNVRCDERTYPLNQCIQKIEIRNNQIIHMFFCTEIDRLFSEFEKNLTNSFLILLTNLQHRIYFEFCRFIDHTAPLFHLTWTLIWFYHFRNECI